MSIELVKRFARDLHYESVEYLGVWKGWECYSLVRDANEVTFEGLPLMAMVRGAEVRISTGNEAMEALDFFFPDDYEDDEEE